MERNRRLAWQEMQEKRRKEEKEEQLKDRRRRWKNPQQREDFDILYRSLQSTPRLCWLSRRQCVKQDLTAVIFILCVFSRVEVRGGAAHQLLPAGSREEGGSVRAAGAGAAVHLHHRTAADLRSGQQLRQSSQELTG